MTRMRRLHARYGVAIEEAIAKAEASRGMSLQEVIDERHEHQYEKM